MDLLRDLCGVARYDLDSQECVVDDRGWKPRPIRRLLKGLSYSDSFLQPALAAAGERGLEDALYVLAQYEYAYTPTRARRKPAADPVFLGVFEYDDDDDREMVFVSE